MSARTSEARTSPPRSTLGERVRRLRIARGLTQAELAGDRFTKQYVSEIERDATRPTEQTLAWLATRLGVDPHFLALGLSSNEYERAEACVARAEAAIESHDYAMGIEILRELDTQLAGGAAPEIELRALLAEAWARMYLGEVREAIALLQDAQAIATGPELTDVDRAEVLFRLGCCRYKLSSIPTAVALLNEALVLAETSGLPCDRLRTRILGWRSRCYRRQRDWEAAREDIEQALELAEALNDRRAIADAHFLGSLVAERQGRWVLARTYAERAKAVYEEVDDRANVGKLLTTLGGLAFLLGRSKEAVAHLKDAYRAALDVGSAADAAQAINSLAQVHLRTGRVELAEEQARQALSMLGGRVDFLDEIGNAQLVLGHSLLEQGRVDEAEREFEAAERSFEQLSSASHRAAAWTGQAKVAIRRGDRDTAIRLYEHAVDVLQDFRF